MLVEVKTNFSATFDYEPLSDERAGVRRPNRMYLQQFYMDTGCSLEDLLEAMDE